MKNSNHAMAERQQALEGGAYATVAFLIWGAFPVYYKLIDTVPALELLCHRITWSAILPIVIMVLSRRWHVVSATLKCARSMKALCLSTLMIAGNWYLFIWAATNDHVLDSSLGYFITPLFSVLLGVMVLGERLRSLQWVALALAFAGVAVLVIRYGQVPWVAILIAVTFSIYGLIRKVAKVDPVTGLFFETTMSLPITVGYLSYLGFAGSGDFITAGMNFSLLLIGTGLISTVPLLFFISGAKRLRLSTVGFFQYILPTCHFVLAVWVYREPFSFVQLSAFVFIWVALAVYSFDTFRHSNNTSINP